MNDSADSRPNGDGPRLHRGTGTPTAPPPRPVLSWILLRAIRMLGLLPLWPLQIIGAVVGGLASMLPLRERRISEINLRIAYPELDDAARSRLVRQSLIETAKTFVELSAAWGWSRDRLWGYMRERHGEEVIQQALAAGRGVIVAGPHLGNWEIGGLELTTRYTVTGLYQPLRITELDEPILSARKRFGANVVPVGASAVRTLMAGLKRGEMVGILPDQDPSEGMGVFVPFFGVEANTMTLLSKLARRSGALVVVAYAQRLPRGRGFDAYFFPVGDDVLSADVERSAAALNETVERCVRHCPQQYMWSYKRYRTPPPGGRNPYSAG